MNGCITCEDVVIGGVPSEDELSRLKRTGITTLVDVREDTRAGKDVSRAAEALGLRYVSAPISREFVDVGQIDRFKQAVAGTRAETVYAFSTGGRRPLGALCFLSCAETGDSVIEVFQKAKEHGLSIDHEDGLKKFILDFYSSHRGDMLNNYFQHHPRHA